MNMIRKIFATRRPTAVKGNHKAAARAYFKQFSAVATNEQLERIAHRYHPDNACGTSLDLQWRNPLAELALDAGCEITARLINAEMGGGTNAN